MYVGKMQIVKKNNRHNNLDEVANLLSSTSSNSILLWENKDKDSVKKILSIKVLNNHKREEFIACSQRQTKIVRFSALQHKSSNIQI